MKKTTRRKEMLLKGIAMLLILSLAAAACWQEIGTLWPRERLTVSLLWCRASWTRQ